MAASSASRADSSASTSAARAIPIHRPLVIQHRGAEEIEDRLCTGAAGLIKFTNNLCPHR